QERYEKGSSEFRDLAEIARSCKRAFSLTRQLLMFSRRQGIRPVLLDLNDIVGNMKVLLGRLMVAEIEIDAELCQEPAVIRADEGQIEQILTNLVINARDAMAQSGKILIKTRTDPEQGCIYLLVKDTGSGMNPETLTHLFEPFFTT